jgi:hypothetical protein
MQLLPILLSLRPKDPRGAGVDLKSCELLATKVRVEDRDCLVLRKVSGQRFDEWFVDPDRGFTINRYEVRVREDLKVRIDLTYHEGPNGTWLPSAWHSLFFAGGALLSDCNGTISSVTVNVPVAAEKFELAFPANTWVTDHLRKKSYLVRADGSEANHN